ncbi:MAG: hypothetical protein ABR906_06365 [Terracidiphilus sp.]|jgi:hypothetical protein
MKFALPRIVAIAAALVGLAISCAAQSTPTPPDQSSRGKVIFSRSIDENGETTTTQPAASVQPPASEGASDVERQAVTFTALDLDVHLHAAEQQIAVRALLTVRNDGTTPLTRIPLQLSSSLNWERIRVTGIEGQSKDISFQVATLNSDADHTGQLHEAVIPLFAPLAPGESLQLDVTYSGQISATAQRLTSIGAPADVAQHSDWDQISSSFTCLRGFGNVVWYPVASVPVLLGDGARLFDELDEHKLRLTGAHFRLRLTVEFPHGQAPTVALINGRSVPLTITDSKLDQSQEVASVATAALDGERLSFEAPSLFVAIRTPHPGTNLTAWTLPEDEIAVQYWTTAATAVTSFLQGWLGQHPRSPLTLLDLPDPEDAPFESGALLAAPLREPNSKANPQGLDGVLVHALTHAWLESPQPPPAWLNEGVAAFMGTLWIERQQGRDQALRVLEAERAALTLAEPEKPGQSSGQPLTSAISPVYYRTKAAYVLWMLRDLVGDQALADALRTYNPAVSKSFDQVLEESANRPDLAWFFADWVNADKGLPDLSIDGIFPTTASQGNWLVAVNIVNNGYATAEVPVTVRSGTGPDAHSATQRVRIPARGLTVQRILILGKPTEVQVNDGTVPEIQASMHITRLDQPAE